IAPIFPRIRCAASETNRLIWSTRRESWPKCGGLPSSDLRSRQSRTPNRYSEFHKCRAAPATLPLSTCPTDTSVVQSALIFGRIIERCCSPGAALSWRRHLPLFLWTTRAPRQNRLHLCTEFLRVRPKTLPVLRRGFAGSDILDGKTSPNAF